MKKCGDCHFYKNGCLFSETQVPGAIIENFVACINYVEKGTADTTSLNIRHQWTMELVNGKHKEEC